MSTSGADDPLMNRAAGGDARAVGELLARFRERLKTMVRLRMDRRLQGRVDPSDVLQDAYLEASQRVGDYFKKQRSSMPFFLWLRFLTAQRLLRVHRHHLGAEMRDANAEVSLYHGSAPEADTLSLAGHLLGRLTAPDAAAARAELQIRLQQVLDSIDPLDREVLTLRHFEELTNGEVAQVLGISKTAASNRYVRALTRLREAWEAMGLGTDQ